MVLKEEFQPNTRDVEIIRLCYEHRYLTTDLLAALLVRPPTEGRQYGFTLSALRARCHKLRTNGLLTWHHMTDQPIGRWHHTKHPAVYSIGSKAVPLIAGQYGQDPKQIRSIIKRNAVGSYFLRHYLGIAKFRICLLLACQAQAEPLPEHTATKVRLGSWLQDGLKDSVIVGAADEAATIPVVPDAVFSLIVEHNGNTTLSHFALELDRGTMPLTDISRKARGYWHYIEKGLHRRRYTYAGQAGPDLKIGVVQKQWDEILPMHQQEIVKHGIKTLQVLFVTQAVPQDIDRMQLGVEAGRLRQYNMADAIRRTTDIHLSTSRFLFATEGLDYDLDRSDALLSTIWQTIAPNSAKRSLLPNLDVPTT